MIAISLIVLLIAVAVLWAKLRFWRWAAQTRLAIIDEQRKTIEQYTEQRQKELAYNKAFRDSEWPETIEEK